MAQIGVAEAARQLGLSERVLRRRLARGDVPGENISGRWLLDTNVILQLAKHRAPAGRPLAPNTAWSLLSALTEAGDAAAASLKSWAPASSASSSSLGAWAELLNILNDGHHPNDPHDAAREAADDVAGEAGSGHPDPHEVLAARERAGRQFRAALDRQLRHRLQGFLRDNAADERFALALRRRGHLVRYWCHPGVLDALLHDPRVVVGGAHAIAAAGADLSTGSRHRIYVRAGDVPDLSLRYQLEVDPDGDLEILAIPDDVPETISPTPGGQTPVAAALVDLLEDPDARSRSLAEHWLQALVKAALQPSDPSGQSAQRTARRREQTSAQ